MAQPTWVTEPGSLGTIPESRFYRVSLEAFDPDFPADPTKVKYVKLSGDLPKGIQVDPNGVIEGTPILTLQGIPNLVSENTISKFAIRSFTEKIVNGKVIPDRINDRTFTMTVVGQDIPEFVTPPGLLGSFFDGEAVDIQIEFTDEDPDDIVTISLISGELPSGLTIDNNGLISGHIAPISDTGSAVAGFEAEAWDGFPYQFNVGTISRTYEFVLRVTDGTDANLRTYSIFVGIITADSTAFTVDTELFTADIISRAPFLDPYTPDLGTFLHDNYFSYQFNGVDFNGDILNYSVVTSDTTLLTADSKITADLSSALPTGLMLDTETGFMHGTIAEFGLVEKTFSFTILVYKKDNPIVVTAFPFTMEVVGNINTGFEWVTDKNLGTINNGSISELSIRAESTIPFCCYLIKSGSNSKLPQGLQLTIAGNIIGRVSYQTFGIISFKTTTDSNDVTIDTSLMTSDVQGFDTITFDNDTTTVDKTFTFTVEAFSADMRVSTFRTFTITVVRKYDRPSHELRINALPPLNDRKFIDTLLFDETIINRDLLYRGDDPYFSIATKVSHVHAFGLNPETLLTYVEALRFNHYDRNLILGEIKTAIALNDDGEIQYEVVYSSIVDDLTAGNVSVGKSVNTEAGIVYPGSLHNMRLQVVDNIGQVSSALPRWMTSVQSDGNVLGFRHAWVIAYTLPGQSSQVAYTINQNWEVPAYDGTHRRRLHRVDYTIDRYTLGSQFIKNWNTVDQRWSPSASTTFDMLLHVALTIDSNMITVDKTIGTTTRLLTSDIDAGSVDSTTADTITVTADTTVSEFVPFTVDLTSTVDFDLAGTETIFDGGSCRFIGIRRKSADIINDTADNAELTTDGGLIDTSTTFEFTDKFDKYLLFPRLNVINKKKVVTDII